MTYREMIIRMKKEWIGMVVSFRGTQYRVVDVDYNGALLIDRPQYYCETYTAPTTAVDITQIERQG